MSTKYVKRQLARLRPSGVEKQTAGGAPVRNNKPTAKERRRQPRQASVEEIEEGNLRYFYKTKGAGETTQALLGQVGVRRGGGRAGGADRPRRLPQQHSNTPAPATTGAGQEGIQVEPAAAATAAG